jgi:hypothetical protein
MKSLARSKEADIGRTPVNNFFSKFLYMID